MSLLAARVASPAMTEWKPERCLRIDVPPWLLTVNMIRAGAARACVNYLTQGCSLASGRLGTGLAMLGSGNACVGFTMRLQGGENRMLHASIRALAPLLAGLLAGLLGLCAGGSAR